MTSITHHAAANLAKIRATRPLIHNITNFVVMNFNANVLLAMGASPVMAHAPEEVAQMAACAGALVLNIGTLSAPWVEAMLIAGKSANSHNIPVIFDPVGAGATNFRTETAQRIINEIEISIIRGNASEILALNPDTISQTAVTKGVDSTRSVDEAAESAAKLAQTLGTTLAITGPIDLITDGKQVLTVANGHASMPLVTGTGCAATAVIGAFAAIDQDQVRAAASALSFFGLAGEMAGRISAAPGSFMVAFQDALSLITEQDLLSGAKITIQH